MRGIGILILCARACVVSISTIVHGRKESKRQRRTRTHFLVFVEAEQAEAQVDHAGVGEERDGLGRTAQVGGVVALFVGGQGLCHALQDVLRAEGVARHGVC